MTDERITPILSRYQGYPFLCVADCDEPAPWVLTRDLDEMGEPVDGWYGMAWCDDHRPETESNGSTPEVGA